MSSPSFGCIFDMDGVLVLSSEAHFATWQVLASELGTPFTRELFDATFGMHNNQIIPLWLGRPMEQAEIDAMAGRKEALYRELAPTTLQAVPGVVELVHRLHEAGVLLAVGSSGPRANVEMVVRLLGIETCFQALASGDEVSHGKPHPEIFINAARRIGLPNARCVVLEDAPQGVEAAIAAGSPVIAITTTRPHSDLAGATRIVDCFTGLEPGDMLSLLSPQPSIHQR